MNGIFLALLMQATAQISGNVRDQSGAVLPGVEVTGKSVFRSRVTHLSEHQSVEQPALGTIGNMRPANILGPANWQFDLACFEVNPLPLGEGG